MVRNQNGNIVTGQPRNPNDRFFYVSIVDGARYGLLYGPLDTYEKAQALVPLVRRVAGDLNSGQAAFAAFGVAGSESLDRPGLIQAQVDKALEAREVAA